MLVVGLAIIVRVDVFAKLPDVCVCLIVSVMRSEPQNRRTGQFWQRLEAEHVPVLNLEGNKC